MSDNKTSSGIGFSSLLLLAFIILKLTNTIDWSWWWVLCPLWIIPAILLVGFVIYLIIKMIIK